MAVPFQLAGRLQISTEIFQADPSEAVPALLLDFQSCRGSMLLKKKHPGTARDVQKTLSGSSCG